MRRVLVAVTNLMFVAHILFGCCLHHAHGDEGERAAAREECGHHHCCHHATPATGDADHSEHNAPADDHEPTTPCEHGRCSFVKCDTQRVDVSPALAFWTPLATVDVLAPSYDPTLAADVLSVAVTRADCPLHVLYCALLV
jgi:hypothetical protein